MVATQVARSSESSDASSRRSIVLTYASQIMRPLGGADQITLAGLPNHDLGPDNNEAIPIPLFKFLLWRRMALVWVLWIAGAKLMDEVATSSRTILRNDALVERCLVSGAPNRWDSPVTILDSSTTISWAEFTSHDPIGFAARHPLASWRGCDKQTHSRIFAQRPEVNGIAFGGYSLRVGSFEQGSSSSDAETPLATQACCTPAEIGDARLWSSGSSDSRSSSSEAIHYAGVETSRHYEVTVTAIRLALALFTTMLRALTRILISANGSDPSSA